MNITQKLVLKAIRLAPAGLCTESIAGCVSDSLNEWMKSSNEAAALKKQISELEANREESIAGFSRQIEQVRMKLDMLESQCPHPASTSMFLRTYCDVCGAEITSIGS